MTASPPQGSAPSSTRVIRVTDKLREAAALRLVQSGAPSGSRTPRDARALLRAAREQGFNFDYLFAAVREPEHATGEVVGGVAWAVEGAGNTWMLFTSSPEHAAEADELGLVIDAACNAVETAGLAQALIDPGQDLAHRSFLAGGFHHLAHLKYLRLHIPPEPTDPPPDWPAMGVELVPMTKATEAELASALTRSYEGTLDCPGLSEMRPIEDVITSHKATGVFDPEWWWLLRDTTTRSAAGALLLTPCPDQGSVELVYIGLAPDCRGRGVARALLEHAAIVMRQRKEKILACAVDERNTPALKLYDALGFTGFARRTALVRPLRG